MGQEKDRERGVRERIGRLRKRLADANERPAELAAVLKAILDLLEDEL